MQQNELTTKINENLPYSVSEIRLTSLFNMIKLKSPYFSGNVFNTWGQR